MPIEPVSSYNTPDASTLSSRSETVNQADFLKMLTAQLQAQDPLNPLQGHEFASQLATFSQLQELENINTTLESSLSSNLLLTQSINNNMAAALVGKTVRAELNQINLGSAGEATLHYTLPEAATEISVDVLDADGNVVRTIEVTPQSAGDVSTVWDGLDSNGTRAPAGDYTFKVQAADVDGNEVAVDTYTEGVITAVNYADGGVTLLVNGVEIRLGQVISILDGTSDSTDPKTKG